VLGAVSLKKIEILLGLPEFSFLRSLHCFPSNNSFSIIAVFDARETCEWRIAAGFSYFRFEKSRVGWRRAEVRHQRVQPQRTELKHEKIFKNHSFTQISIVKQQNCNDELYRSRRCQSRYSWHRSKWYFSRFTFSRMTLIRTYRHRLWCHS
jgi:hypothetical protein